MAEGSFLSNQLLIAMPTLEDPNFARGVTYLCQHNEHGALGSGEGAEGRAALGMREGGPAAGLEQELRRARQAAGISGPEADLLPVLEALWRAWPGELRIQVDTVGLDPQRLVLRGRVPDPETAQALAAALPRLQLPGGAWRAEPLDVPRITPEAASFLLAFAPEDAEGAP